MSFDQDSDFWGVSRLRRYLLRVFDGREIFSRLCSILYGGLAIAETMMFWLTLAEPLICKGYRGFLQAAIETNSHLFIVCNNPLQKMGCRMRVWQGL